PRLMWLKAGQSNNKYFPVLAARCFPVCPVTASLFQGISAGHGKHLAGFLPGLEELPLGDGPYKCPGQWRYQHRQQRQTFNCENGEMPAPSTAVTAGSRTLTAGKDLHRPDDI
ncbi:hypothetical protein, partial [Citrobacter freundii]|uniref:hypothetical protein n=1 Tax=Citrobacter freundii TaxID=546 RepID=UPI003862C6D3